MFKWISAILKKLSKKSKFFLIGLVVFLVIFLSISKTLLSSDIFSQYFTSKVLTLLSSPNFHTSFERPRIGLFSFKADQADILINLRSFLFSEKLELKDLITSYNPLTFAFTKNINILAKTYNGEINAKIHLGDPINVNGGFSNLELKEHHQASSLGILAGTISFNCEECIFSQNLFKSKNSKLTINNLSKPSPTILNFPGSPFPIPIPSFQNLNLESTVISDGETLTLKNINLKSSLGKISGLLEFKLIRNKLAINTIDLDVALESDGMDTLGPYLQILGAGALPKTERNFHVNLQSGNLRSLKFTPKNN